MLSEISRRKLYDQRPRDIDVTTIAFVVRPGEQVYEETIVKFTKTIDKMFDAVGTNKSTLKYIASIVAAWYFYQHFIRPFLSPLRKIPGRPYIPFIGNMLEAMRKGANNNAIRWMQMYNSRIVRFYFMGGEGAVLVGDPALAKHILLSNSKYYHRSSSSFLTSITPGFLALISGEEHHALRRLINPVFSSHSIGGYVPSFEAIGRKLVTKWSAIIGASKDAVIIEAQEHMTCLTLDAICHCGFDYEMKSLDNNKSEEVEVFNRILGGLELSLMSGRSCIMHRTDHETSLSIFTIISVLGVFGLNWLPTKKNRKIWSDIHTFKSCITQVISAKQQKMDEGLSSKDILTQLLQASDDKGQHLSKDSLYAQVGGFLFAGFETTSMTLTWTLLELARRPEIQEKVREEVMKLLPDKSAPITSEIVENMIYLTAVVKEALRHNIPISTVFRRALRGDYLGKYYIPRGTLVGIHLGALHKLPQNWPDPLEFKPERFLDDYDKYAFLPFGAGPYMCVGSQFSLVETKITLALILRHFVFYLPANYDFKTIRKLTLQPSPPLQLMVTPLKE